MRLAVSLGKPLAFLLSVTPANVPSDADRTSPDIDVSPLALKVK